MRIALVTYEFPPDIPQGGIATYTLHIAKGFVELGHDVEIFAGSFAREGLDLYKQLKVHRILIKDVWEFNRKVVSVFQEQNSKMPFDILETPEINGNGIEIRKALPTIPIVVRLHMPAYLQVKLLNFYTSWKVKARFFLGGLKRGQINTWGKLKTDIDIDFQMAKASNGITAPSSSMKEIAVKDWKIKSNEIEVIPNPFMPEDAFLNIPKYAVKSTADDFIVVFYGKINIHKGIVKLVEAIPELIKIIPRIKFVLIGNYGLSPNGKMSLKDWITSKLGNGMKSVTLMEGVERIELISYLRKADICIFPSIWENFGYVCLEAMSAGRAVIGSKHGGMSDIIVDDTGILIDALKSKEIVKSITFLYNNPAILEKIAKNGKIRAIEGFDYKEISKNTISYYQTIIGKSKYISLS